MSKLLAGVIADQIYTHLDHKKLLTEEQKRCRKSSRGTNDLPYIDRTVIKESLEIRINTKYYISA